ncbi:MAG: RHS repeat protein [Candidatus Aenigmarchaeota archaeon]|nr:RHS repeat protein [Candidatus Aenigmarchaeota archaeon]
MKLIILALMFAILLVPSVLAYAPNYEYDSKGNLIKIDYPGTINDIEYKYDSKGNVLSVTDSSGKTSYEYTENDLIKKITLPDGREISYKYDAQGRVTEENNEYGVVTTYQYNQNGRISCIDCEKPDTKQTFEYDEAGNVLKYTYGTDYEITQEFDNENKITKIIRNDVEENYNYDLEGRVRSITGDDIKTITFNECGTTYDYTYDENCRILEDDFYTYEYNEETGEMKKTSKWTGEILEYDESNNLVKITNSDDTWETFEYDANNNPISSTNSDGDTTVFKECPSQQIDANGDCLISNDEMIVASDLWILNKLDIFDILNALSAWWSSFLF